MKDGATGSFAQAYNAQAAVDARGQVIIACGVTPSASDAEQLLPMLERIVATTARRPASLMADAGFFSEANLVAAEQAGVDVYIPPDREAHGHALAAGRRHPARAGHASARMRDKLRTADGEALYRRRKAIIEPVFAYIKAIRGFRRFALRGLDKVTAEWAVICLTHNLLKLFRAHRLQHA